MSRREEIIKKLFKTCDMLQDELEYAKLKNSEEYMEVVLYGLKVIRLTMHMLGQYDL